MCSGPKELSSKSDWNRKEYLLTTMNNLLFMACLGAVKQHSDLVLLIKFVNGSNLKHIRLMILHVNQISCINEMKQLIQKSLIIINMNLRHSTINGKKLMS